MVLSSREDRMILAESFWHDACDRQTVGQNIGLQSFGRQDVWATDVWATNFFPNGHLGDKKLDVWATMTSRLGDKTFGRQK